MLEFIGEIVDAGKSRIARSVEEIIRPLVTAEHEAKRDLHKVTTGLATEAQLIPLLVEQLTVLNANLALLTEVLRPVASAERGIASAEQHLHNLFHHGDS